MGCRLSHKNNYLEKSDTSTSTQYSANITSSYDLNMTQKLVRSVGGQMCTTNFKFRPNSIIYPLTVFFHSRPFFTNNHRITGDTISYTSFRNSNKELWLHFLESVLLILKSSVLTLKCIRRAGGPRGPKILFFARHFLTLQYF